MDARVSDRFAEEQAALRRVALLVARGAPRPEAAAIPPASAAATSSSSSSAPPAAPARHAGSAPPPPATAGSSPSCPRDLHDLQAAARSAQAGKPWQADYKRRAGIDAAISQATAVTGCRRARYRGLAKTHLEHPHRPHTDQPPGPPRPQPAPRSLKPN